MRRSSLSEQWSCAWQASLLPGEQRAPTVEVCWARCRMCGRCRTSRARSETPTEERDPQRPLLSPEFGDPVGRHGTHRMPFEEEEELRGLLEFLARIDRAGEIGRGHDRPVIG